MGSLKIKSKKAVTALVFNVIIGIILIVISFFIFFLIMSKLGDATDKTISDAQYLDIVSSYSGFLSKVNKTSLRDFFDVMILFSSKDNFVFSMKVYNYGVFDNHISSRTKIKNYNLIPGTLPFYLNLGFKIIPIRLGKLEILSYIGNTPPFNSLLEDLS